MAGPIHTAVSVGTMQKTVQKIVNFDKNLIIHSIILLPLFWVFSGVFAFANGDKILNVLVPLVVIARIYFLGYKDILSNIKQNKLLWLLVANLLFAIVAYFTYGVSSSRFRILSLSVLYLAILPPSYLEKITFKNLVWILSGSLVVFMFIQYFDGSLFSRGSWSINPIRIGIISAFLANASLYFAITEQDKKHKSIALFFAIIALFPLILSASRGPWLAFGAGSLMLIARTVNLKVLNYKVVFGSVLVLLSVTVMLKQPIAKRIDTTLYEVQQIQSNNMETSIGLRLQMWKAGVEIIKSHWLLGVGDAGQQEVKEQMANEDFISHEAARFSHLHNQWMDDLASYGVFGLFAILLFVIYPLCSSKGTDNKTLIWVLISVYLTVSLTDVPLERSHPFVFYIFCMYMLLRKHEVMKTTTRKECK
ncbi:O-antigen ligase family protein [Photobacterium sp. ZSDE20]|uniref:O-antigen ligase family protein n=1 Tax=Photobacterium pectinilyticum TaxID=2906793 RepID=A0ABT1MYJ6_9GAMM|nr:O-antigen ligase family protein [Photobacterium sp. ZSDE20]MCQ1056744.1 O-antigen ligase family protein [Photobacterium sp. ZSDE20]MDD1820869.1 O-antigen ligase family protein [Photobacterium sp. ZSDE20]